MIEVAHIDHWNPDTAAVETLRICSSPSFIANGYAYEPVLMEMFDYNESLFDRGTTEGETTVGLGTIVINNVDGSFDYLRKHGFDGRTISIYRPLSQDDEQTGAMNLYFTGTIAYADIAWDTVTFYVKSQLENINIPMQTATFAGTNLGTGGSGGYEGSADLAGVAKPQVFGRCLSVPGVPINEFFLMYGFNFNRDGTPKALYKFYNVYVKGVRYVYTGDYATLDLLAATNGIATGCYGSCLAAGVIRLGSVPASNGRIVADCADAAEAQCTAAQVAKRILEDNAGLVAAVNFDNVELQALDDWDSTPVGLYVKDVTTSIADCVNQVLDSIGGWYIPDVSGVFRFGYIDFPDNLVSLGKPIAATFTKSNWSDNIERVAVDDQGQNIPAYSVEVKHSKVWQTQDSGSLADAVTAALRQQFGNEYRSATATSETTLVAHPLAPSLSYETLLQDQLYFPLANGDFSIAVATAGNGWTLSGTGVSSTQAGGRITVTPTTAIGILSQSIGYEDMFTSVVRLEFGFTLAAGSQVTFRLVRGIGNTVIVANTYGPFTSDTYQTFLYDVPAGQSPALWDGKIQFLTVSTTTPFTIGDVFLRAVTQGIGVQGNASRRLLRQSSYQERYNLTVSSEDFYGNDIWLGSLLKLQDDKRFGMQNGLVFLVIGVDPSDDDYEVTLDVWRGEKWPSTVT